MLSPSPQFWYPCGLAPTGRVRRWRAAFTLVEVVLAIGIFAFGIVALVSLIATGLQVNREAQNEVLASVIARDVFAKLNAPYAWTPTGAQRSGLEHFVGTGQSLQDLAEPGAPPQRSLTWFDANRRVVQENDPEALFKVESEIGPVSAFTTSSMGGLGLDPTAASSLSLNNKTVWVRLTVQFPKSQNLDQQFVTLITKPAP